MLGWFVLALIVMGCWGVQAFFMKLANHTMSAESIFFYMMLTGLMLAPVAWTMTDFSRPVNWGADGVYLAAGIQLLNSIGALTLVYAFRYGKAIVVSPLTNAGAPLMTAAISLIIIGTLPGRLKLVGLALALIAAILLAIAPEETDTSRQRTARRRRLEPVAQRRRAGTREHSDEISLRDRSRAADRHRDSVPALFIACAPRRRRRPTSSPRSTSPITNAT